MRSARSWVSLIGGGLALAASPWSWIVIPNLIYGAVKLYGTDPLERRRAERQLDEDQR